MQLENKQHVTEGDAAAIRRLIRSWGRTRRVGRKEGAQSEAAPCWRVAIGLEQTMGANHLLPEKY